MSRCYYDSTQGKRDERRNKSKRYTHNSSAGYRINVRVISTVSDERLRFVDPQLKMSPCGPCVLVVAILYIRQH